MKTFSIHIGPEFKAEYELVETTAPADYDSFGTISLHDAKIRRWVLVRVEHKDWQVPRYRSGMFEATTYDDIDDAVKNWITQQLYERLLKGNA